MNEYVDLLAQVRQGAGAGPTTTTTTTPPEPPALPVDDEPARLLQQVRNPAPPRAAVEAALYEASFSKPDHEAQLRDVSKKLQTYFGDTTPPAVLDLQAAQRRVRVAEQDHATRASPLTSAFLSNAENARIAADDAQTLAKIEKVMGAVGTGLKAVKTGLLFDAQAAFFGGVAAPLEVGEQALKAVGVPDWLANSDLARLARGWSERSKRGGAAQGVPEGEGTLEKGTIAGFRSLGTNLLTLPLGVLKGPEFATRAAAFLAGGASYVDARDTGASPLTAFNLATHDAAAEYATERLGMKALFDQPAFRNAFVKQAAKFTALEMGGEQIATIWQDFNKWTVLNPDKTAAEFIAERPEAAAQTAIATLVGAGGQVALVKSFEAVLRNESTAAQAEASAGRMTELFALAAESLTGQRSPDTFEQFFQTIAPDATVLIDPDKLQEVLLQADIDPAKLPSFIEQANTSQAGAGIEIPVHELIAAFTGTGAEAALIPHVRFGADMPTLAESREAGTKAAEFFQKEADRILEEQSRNEEFVAGAKAVQDDIKAQLDSLGRFGPQATSGYAALTGAFYTTMASQLGVTPLQLRDGWTDAQGVARRGYKLTIGGEQNANTAQSLNQLQPATQETFTKAGIPNLLKTDNWTILTAENPNAKQLSPEENATRNAELQQYLTAQGYDFTPVKGHYGQPENSFVVTGISPEQAQALAKKFEQESVLTRHGLVYQDGSITPSNGLTVHPSQPEDFYTTLPDGTHFTVGLDFEGPRQQLSDVLNQSARDFQTVTPAQIDAIRKEVAWTETGTENGFPVWKNAQVALTSPVDVTEGHDVFYKPLGNERAVKYQIQDANGRSVGYTVLELADGWPTLLLDIEVAETERGKRYAEQTVAAIANDAGELGIWHIVPSARSWWERIGAAPVDAHNGTIDFNGYADARASRENAQGLGRKLYQSAEVSKPGAVAGPVVGVHFSREKRGMLSSGAFGTGLTGAERERLQNSNDDRIKQRIAFYVSNGQGVFPEAGVGGAAHVATLTNLYDADADALKLWRNNPRDANAAESAVVDAGFDGYLQRNNFNNQGTVVLLGARSVSAPHVGGLAEANAQTAAPPPAEIPALKAAAIALANDKTLPGGALTPAKWKEKLEARDPQLAAQIDFGMFKADEPIYKDQLSGALWQEADQWYYSQLRRSVEQAPAKIFATGASIKQWLLSNTGKLGIKKDEIEWTGITDWLDAQPKASKDDVLAFLDQGGVKVEEVMLGTPPGEPTVALEDGKWVVRGGSGKIFGKYSSEEDAVLAAPRAFEHSRSPTKFAQYVLPGGEKYRELLLTLPAAAVDTTGWTAKEDAGDFASGPTWAVRDARGRWVLGVPRENVATAAEAISHAAGRERKNPSNFQSSHFDQPNILTHIRFNERTDAEGNRVFFVEEIQADKGQRWRALKDRIAKGEASEAERAEFAGIDAMPFNETKAWTALAMKRVIAYAAENGFDKVAWTTGEQQAARYDLSKQISRIEYADNGNGRYHLGAFGLDGQIAINETMDASKLEDTVGKEITKKIVGGEGTEEGAKQSGHKVLSGLDLKVGGEGMKGFYDQIVPQVARDVLKKLGGGPLETVSVPRKGRQGKSMRAEDVARQKTEGTLTEQPGFPITDSMRATVAQGLPLFAAKNGDKLGSFNPNTLDLRLLADANLSTFLHETGHFFLTVYADLASQPDAPAELTKGMAEILKQFGVADVAAWQAMPLELQRPYHEQFAESFEQYLFTGKAPSLELQPLFQRFASWLTRVYVSIKDFIAGHEGAKLNPELAAVFDRMLATENEIAAANAARGFVALFKDATEAGMSDKDFAAYTALSVDQKTDAEEMLRTRGLRDMKWLENRRNKVIAELQADAKERRDAVLKEVSDEVAATPLRKAMRWLKRGEMTGADGAEIKAPGGNKLQISELEEMFPEGALVAPPDWKKLGYGQYGMLAAEGLSPDLVAEMFGIPSGQELVSQLLGATKFADEVNALTDQRMLEQYGDLSSQDAISRAADEAIHNDARTRMVATELSALAKNVGAPSVLMKAAREYARQIVETKSSKTLKPWSFAAAETRAGKAALEALRKGDREKAAGEKRTELVNHVAAKEAYAAEKEIKKIVDRLKAIVAYKDDSSSVKTRDADIVNAVRAILADFGIGTKGKAAREYLAVVQANNPDLAAVLSDTIDAVTAEAKAWQELPLSKLRGLSEEVNGLWFLAKRSKQVEIDGKLIPMREAQDELHARLVEIGIPDHVPGEGSAVTAAEKRGILFDRFVGALRRVESWAGAKDGTLTGPFRKFMWNPVRDAADAYRADKVKYLKAYRDLLAPIAPTLTRQTISAPELDYVFGKDESGLGKAELLHAILHTGNESNKRKLLLGRGWATEQMDKSLDTSKWDAFIERMENEGKITKADYDFAQGVWDLMEGMKPLAQKAHRDVFGRYFSEVSADALVTRFGTYRGGYVPALTDPLIVRDADLRVLAETENSNMAFAFPATTKGFTKSRVESYAKPLKLDLRALSQHIDKVLLFSHMTRPVNDVRRMMSGKAVAQALGRVDPQAYNTLIIPWLNRAAKQVVETQTPGREGLGRFWSVVRGRAGMAAMFGNLANAVQQVTGLSLAAVRVRPALLLDAMAKYAMSPATFAEQVTGKSSYMATRLENEVSMMSDQINDILLNPTIYENAKNWTSHHAYFLQSAVDSVISPVVWLGGYNQAIEAGMSEADAIRAGDSAVRETQGSTAPEDIASFESGTAFYRMFVQFAGYFNMNANLLGTEYVKLTRDIGLRAGAGRGLYLLVLGFLAPAIVGELIMQAFKGGPDDDDKDGEYMDDWLMTLFAYAPARYLTAMVPGFGQVINAAANTLNNKPYDDRISTAPAISMIESAVKAPLSVYKAIAEDGKPSRAIKDVATLISMTVGVPASAAARPISYLSDVAGDRVAPTGPVDLVRGTITGVATPASKQ